MIRILLLLVALLGAPTAPASAAAPDATPRPEIIAPLPSTHIQIVGHHAWGVRRFAREVSAEIPALSIALRGRCGPREVCVTFRADPTMSASYGALTSFPDARHRVVSLNTSGVVTGRAWRYAIAVHEFGHALGLGHHLHHGIDGAYPNEVHLSHGERRLLRTYYRAR